MIKIDLPRLTQPGFRDIDDAKTEQIIAAKRAFGNNYIVKPGQMFPYHRERLPAFRTLKKKLDHVFGQGASRTLLG